MKLFVPYFLALTVFVPRLSAAEDVAIIGVPDYAWHAGCFGTASGNLMGYWDRNGFPNFYTGPTGDGVAPLNSSGANRGIRSLWASRAGFDGRPEDQPGHVDDYWTYLESDQIYSYESTEPDPYVIAGRPEHEPDCLGDFMGASQNKWTDFDGECSGNIDAYAFNYWNKQGAPRTNFIPPTVNGVLGRDVQSGLRAWTQYRGADAQVISQLVDFNPETPSGSGFTFADLKAEILRGYPVVLILQNHGEWSRDLPGMPKANPNIHAMVAHRFKTTDDGYEFVQYRTSWASGDGNSTFSLWGPQRWQANLSLRGVILYRPIPTITGVERADGKVTIRWDGPSTLLWDDENQLEIPAHLYAVESAPNLSGPFTRLGDPVAAREMTVTDPGGTNRFFRIKLFTPAYDGVGGI